MLQWKRKRGFTLIELLVVVIIVAVLASVGVPLLSANIERSQMTEAETGLGTIRTALRAYIVEKNEAPTVGTFLTDLGFAATDFQGQFFESDDYTLVAGATTTNYCINAKGDTGGTAPGGKKVDTKVRSMNEFGTIFKALGCPTSPAS